MAMQAGSGDALAALGCDHASAKAAIVAQLQVLLLGSGAEWRLDVAASEVAGGGEGVHVRGTCEAGTVLACYPGVVYLPEDLPVMPVEYAGFMLKPNNFFAANPAMDLPPEADAASVQHGAGGACCT